MAIPGRSCTATSGDMYSLKWNHHQNYLTSGLAQLLDDMDCSMTDVTLACEGQFIEAHKIILSICSPFFKQLFRMNRTGKAGSTVVVMANLRFKELQSVVQFIYHGQVHVANADLNSFLQAAEMLKIEGLAGGLENNRQNTMSQQENVSRSPEEQSVSSISQSTILSTGASTSTHRFNNNGAPPVKRSRIISTGCSNSSTSTPPPTTSTNVTASLRQGFSNPLQAPITGSDNEFDPLADGEGSLEDIGEEMISLENMKSEAIAVYTITDDNTSSRILDPGTSRSLENRNTYGASFKFSDVQGNRSSDLSGPGPSSAITRLNALPKATEKFRGTYSSLPRVLNGIYFQVINIDQSTGGVNAKCLVCQKVIKGRLHPSSNFTTHLKKHEEIYKSYKQLKKGIITQH